MGYYMALVHGVGDHPEPVTAETSHPERFVNQIRRDALDLFGKRPPREDVELIEISQDAYLLLQLRKMQIQVKIDDGKFTRLDATEEFYQNELNAIQEIIEQFPV